VAVAAKGRLRVDGKRLSIAAPKLDWPACATKAA